MSNTLGFRQALLDGARYVPDWSGTDRGDYIRLDRNEGAQPIPDFVRDTLIDHITNAGVHMYPETDSVRASVGAYCGVPADFVMPTGGSVQAIELTLQAFLDGDRRMLVARPEFPVFGQVATTQGADVIGVRFEQDLGFPYLAFREAAAGQPDLIVLINPNNPTGTPIDRAFIEEMVRTYPSTPVVVDEAYFEFTGETVVDLVENNSNLIVLRTFSKAFAMAGLRFGYLVANPEVITQIVKLRNAFVVNSLAVVAAEAYLKNTEPSKRFVDETMNVIKPKIVDHLRNAGVTVWSGAANFVVVKPNDGAGAVDFLKDNGILVRPIAHPYLTGSFRMSIGNAEEMQKVTRVFDAYLSR